MDISKDAALKILEAMLEDGAKTFTKGVESYIDALDRELKARKKLSQAIAEIRAAESLKSIAISVIRQEWKFFMGKEPVSPQVNGEYVLSQLIINTLDGITDEMYEYMTRPKGDEKEIKEDD